MDTAPIAGLGPLNKRERLREMVADALRAAVISGEMRPGAVYSAPTLSQMFGISATPVREAMLDLVREGMVEALPNKGYRVRIVPEEELDEVTHVRLLLEPPTVRDVVPLVPEADFPRLRELADAIVTAVREDDLVAYIHADRVFHLALLDYAGNSQLTTIVAELRLRTRLLGLTPLLESGQLESSALEHHELLDRIEARDAEGARSLMERHIGHVRGKWARGTPEDGGS
ncbi:FCD domain-containing protein [Streptomyces sp. 3MP-14]|uniref:FCD domain-containing protein n=1 Tax=Streptomyces mimosae TaxID=2586635 RepID=A0A5N6AM06_9ACTN|nr:MULTISPECIES: GntR family transcriptional regulator [Streptomyces]KAB8169877.1 FCD domain-containing protein [Streptomyces mimosae]KAB8178625.1 FCD domain-containing protein [Streptomyces sp. 3MP-14]